MNIKILLASKSPRRSQLLQQAGFDFEVIPMDIEETYPPEMPLEMVPEYLAQKKAHAAKEAVKAGAILLASDSIVIIDDMILGKPENEFEARQMLRRLSGRMHKVITGVCLLSMDKERVFSEVTDVYFDAMNDEEIDYYVKNFRPLDKAGAYAIQEWVGLCKIYRIEGTYSNVMGLPVNAIYRALEEF